MRHGAPWVRTPTEGAAAFERWDVRPWGGRPLNYVVWPHIDLERWTRRADFKHADFRRPQGEPPDPAPAPRPPCPRRVCFASSLFTRPHASAASRSWQHADSQGARQRPRVLIEEVVGGEPAASERWGVRLAAWRPRPPSDDNSDYYSYDYRYSYGWSRANLDVWASRHVDMPLTSRGWRCLPPPVCAWFLQPPGSVPRPLPVLCSRLVWHSNAPTRPLLW